MKTTVEVPDELYRRAKAEAALRGRKLRDMIEEGLRLVLEISRRSHRRPSLAGLMKRARRKVDEDAEDAEVARKRIAEIEANPGKLLRGTTLEKKLKQWQS
jgi:hypothetical protein